TFEFASVPDDLDTDPPSVPGALTVGEVSDMTAEVSWAPSTDADVGVAFYTIYINEAFWTTTTETEFTLHGFSPETTYAVTITATDALGNVSEASAPAEFTTGPGVPAVKSMQMGNGIWSDTTGMWRSGVDFAAEWANYENSNPFSDAFLDDIRPFKVLRFMDWVATNNNWATDWSERKQPDDQN